MKPPYAYAGDLQLRRLRAALCPECGARVWEHTEWGGAGCQLTADDVTERIRFQWKLDES